MLAEPNDTTIPEWLEDASEAFSIDSRVASDAGADADEARIVLEAAGIPAYVEFCEDPSDDGSPAEHRWRVLVPGKLNLRAASILDRDIFNAQFEETWKAHLEMLSDEELSEAEPRAVFCGLFDQIERATRAYEE